MDTSTDRLALRAGPSGAASIITERVTRAVIETATLRREPSIAEHAPRLTARSSNDWSPADHPLVPVNDRS